MIGVLLLLMMVLVLDVLTTSLNLIAIAGIVTIMAYKWNRWFHVAWVWYLGALGISVAALIWNESPYLAYVYRGYLGYGIFLVVMMVGVLPNRWILSRNIKKVRGNLSILGFILISPHALLHVLEVLDGINLFGIVAYVLMVPLTIVSFQFIKQDIKPKDWLTIQKAAYVIYIALFAHLIMVGDWVDKVVYAVLLTIYLNNKLLKEWKR